MKIRCPSCDAEIAIETDQRVLTCPYCGTPIIAEKSGTLILERIIPDLSREAALDIYRGFFPDGKIGDLKLEYIPYYRLEKNSDVIFIPGKMGLPPSFKYHKPQGDRVTLRENFPAPEISLTKALELAKLEKVENASVIYTPFYTDRERNIYIDGVTGKVVKEPVAEGKSSRDHLVFLAYLVAGLLAIAIPVTWLRIALPLGISFIPLLRRKLG